MKPWRPNPEYWRPEVGENKIRILPPLGTAHAPENAAIRAWTPPIGLSRLLLFPSSRQAKKVTDGRYFPRTRILYEGVVFDPRHQAIVWEISEHLDTEFGTLADPSCPYMDLFVERSGSGRNTAIRVASASVDGSAARQSAFVYDEQMHPISTPFRRIRV